jgi:hypothetical protein
MTDVIFERGRLAVATRIGEITTRLVNMLANDLPHDVLLTEADGGFTLTGKNLNARYASDVRLNGIAMTAKAALS